MPVETVVAGNVACFALKPWLAGSHALSVRLAAVVLSSFALPTEVLAGAAVQARRATRPALTPHVAHLASIGTDPVVEVAHLPGGAQSALVSALIAERPVGALDQTLVLPIASLAALGAPASFRIAVKEATNAVAAS